jgi:hypothetical protein
MGVMNELTGLPGKRTGMEITTPDMINETSTPSQRLRDDP